MNTRDTDCCKGKTGGCTHAGLNRRAFLKAGAATAGGLGLLGLSGGKARAAVDMEAFNAALFETGARRVYRGAELELISMPMGGFGAGQVYLNGKGTLGPWQMLNNFNLHAHAPGSFFAIRTEHRDASGQARVVAQLLEHGANATERGSTEVSFSGEYPFAWLDYTHADLPIAVQLEAFSPFIPLNLKDSALPALVFNFTLKNPLDVPVQAQLLAAAPNLAGWDGYGGLADHRHPDFLGNTVEPAATKTFSGVRMSAQAGQDHGFDRACPLFVNASPVAQAMRHCSNTSLHYRDVLSVPDAPAGDAVVWIDEFASLGSIEAMERAFASAEAGATVIVNGGAGSLLGLIDGALHGSDERAIFESWASGSYEGWTLEGNCFGDAPAEGTFPNQTKVTGYRGRTLLNSFYGGDASTGRATSRTFTIARRYCHLLVGGGDRPGVCCINLVVDGQIVRTATGNNSETLRPVLWEIAEFQGKSAHFEIVDQNSDGWGHILVSEISFGDLATYIDIDRAYAKKLRKRFPFRWRKLTWDDAAAPLDAASEVLAGLRAAQPTAGARWKARGLHLKPHARVLLRDAEGHPLVVAGPYGQGQIVVCLGAVPAWFENVDRKTVIGNLIAAASGRSYQVQQGHAKESPLYGSMALAVSPGGTPAVSHWNETTREAYWARFVREGRFAADQPRNIPPGETAYGAVASTLEIPAHGEARVTFVLAWHFPNRTRDDRYGWGPGPYRYAERLGNRYNTWFDDATGVLDYVDANLDRLTEETRRFHTTFHDSPLPRYLLDAVTANIATIRCPVYLWTEDGAVGGYEGADACCPMNCTHVFNYVMSPAFLFPELERNVRETDLLVQMHPAEHYIPHRTKLPLSVPRLGFEIGGPHHPALDGELGTLLKTYREYRQSGDRAWLAKLFPKVKLHLEYLMRTHDANGEGIIRGEQPNTYDIHTYGSNTFIGTLYLAALRATEEMARAMDDAPFAATCRARFEKGSAAYDRTCWDGEYYYNVYDAPGADAKTYEAANCWGPGCHADQLLGQWWANVLDIGYTLPRERVRQALQAIHKYCFYPDLTGFPHRQRIFAEGTEKGLVCCAWPKGGRPNSPIHYSDEVWTGIEYEVAALLLAEGLCTEALQLVKGARDRYTGNQRNPWAELECGYHYTRAMSSYTLLTEAAGYAYDGARQALRFAPRLMPEQFKAFFATGTGWGSIAQTRGRAGQTNRVELKYGQLALRELQVEVPPAGMRRDRVHARVGERYYEASLEGTGGRLTLHFTEAVALAAGETLAVTL